MKKIFKVPLCHSDKVAFAENIIYNLLSYTLGDSAQNSGPDITRPSSPFITNSSSKITPSDLQKFTVRHVVDGWKTVMKRHNGERRSEALLELVARSVGAKHADVENKPSVKGKD
ncbi:hypothetical protein [Paenibacillus sp. J31TS4]|uniref:hypothetical protein n=1 Tax=Paenibacillus sp. J31TS4 TaxID=2807195 RepID=UPI001BCAC756|nr:hypothetical protein [Paenibacillus sp. J31TS4]